MSNVWDEEEVDVKGKANLASWEDEEEEEEEQSKKPKGKALDSWEDEEEESPKTAAKKTAAPTTKKETPKPTSTTKEGKKSSSTPTKKDSKTSTPANKKTSSEPIDKKLQQQLSEESDLKNTQDLFSGVDGLVNLKNPKDEKDFDGLGENIASKISLYKSNKHYYKIIKSFIRKASADLKQEELNELSSLLAAMANEKLKSDKERNKKKKTTNTKVSINVNTKDPFAPEFEEEGNSQFNEEEDFM